MFKFTRAIALIATVISLAACAPAAPPTPTAAVLNLPAVGSDQKAPAAQPAAATQPPASQAQQPVQPNPTAYAAPADPAAQQPAAEKPTVAPTQAGAGAYPAPGGAAQGMPARENRSKVTAQLLDAVPAPNEAGRLPLHVKIMTSEAVQGMASFTQNLIDKDITLEVDPAGLPELKAGDTFTAFVSYQGDEKGGKYIGSELARP